jgi:hypothetical protein
MAVSPRRGLEIDAPAPRDRSMADAAFGGALEMVWRVPISVVESRVFPPEAILTYRIGRSPDLPAPFAEGILQYAGDTSGRRPGKHADEQAVRSYLAARHRFSTG